MQRSLNPEILINKGRCMRPFFCTSEGIRRAAKAPAYNARFPVFAGPRMSSSTAQFPSFPATIESLDHEGRGVAHVDGKAVFVEGALPREVVEYEPSRKKKNFETAKLTRIIRESTDRVVAKA